MTFLFIPTLIISFIAIGSRSFAFYVIAIAMWYLTLS
jgi:hypothetical protein